MGKRPAVLAIVVAIAALVAGAADAQQVRNGPAQRSIVVGVIQNPPIGIHGNGGEPTGLVYDMLAHVAEEQGWTVRYVDGAWPDLVAGVENGSIDLVGGAAFTEERAKTVDFNAEPVISNWGMVFRNRSVPLTDIRDLAGKRVAGQPRGVHFEALGRIARSFGFAYVEVPANTREEILQFVSDGRADFGVVPRTFYITHGDRYSALPTHIIFNPIQIHYIAPKGRNKDLLDALDAYIREGRADPSSHYSRTVAQWMTSTVRTPTVPVWVYWAMAAAILLAIALFVATRWLSREVARRTAALQSSEAKFRQLAENIREVFWTCTPDWKHVEYVSPSYADVFGRTPQSLYDDARTWMELIHPDDRPAVADNIRKRLAGEPHDAEIPDYRIVRPDGQERIIRARAYDVRGSGGTVERVVGISEDITDQITYEAELRASERRFRDFAEAAADRFWEIGPDYRFRRLYDADESAGDADDSRMIGKFPWELAPRSADDPQWDEVRALLAERRPLRNLEHRFLTESGKEVWWSVSGVPFFDADGNFAGYRGISSDITEMKALERQVAHANRLDAVGQLTGGIAHDFNNLLSAMVGNAELLEERVGDDPATKRMVETIRRVGERGASLTKRLLAFSRKQVLSPKSVQLSDLVANLEDLLRRTLGETVDLRIRNGDGLWSATVDPHEFENAVLNLAINARDAMPDGGRLTIETANVVVEDGFAGLGRDLAPGEYVSVSVSDTGIGMTAEVRERAFEPFFTTKDVGKGSGLGLSMVYGFAKQSSGGATIYSEPGQGTTVRLYLPRSPGETSAVASGDQAPAVASGSGRILVVEDDPDVLALVLAMLEQAGYSVDGVPDGPAALRALDDRGPYDLLFTDLVLPRGMTGADIARAAQERSPGIRILFTTGYAETRLLDDAQVGRGAVILRKPWRRSEVLQSIREALDGAA